MLIGPKRLKDGCIFLKVKNNPLNDLFDYPNDRCILFTFEATQAASSNKFSH